MPFFLDAGGFVLAQLRQVELAFGTHVLLDKVDLDIHAGERLCVVGRNGEGKSTLLKLLSFEHQPDDGVVHHRTSLRWARLQQELPKKQVRNIYDIVADGLGDVGQYLADYHNELQRAEHADLDKVEKLQQLIDTYDGWNMQQKVQSTLDRLALPADQCFSQLSGGWQRRVMLAQALVTEPELLILDEPTNHMDIETVTWLEEQLLQFNGALVFISHDRAFVQRLATRIVEIDRGHLYNWQGDYNSFIDYRDKRLEDEATQNALFDKRLAEEEKWIRQGIKARRTRNQGRVENLKKMRQERSERRVRQGTSDFSVSRSERSGKIVFEVDQLRYAIGDKPLVSDFSCVVSRGDRIGLVGKNGVGKSTLLKLLQQQLTPDSGSVHIGTKLEVAYFDQGRDHLDEEKTIADNVADGKDHVIVQGESRHVIGYLGDFMFSAAKIRTPVKALSGGERNRVLLAKLLLKPCNLLIMDEPTNDLDVETLELLEERLSEYTGTLLLVSHDRAFLDNVVTHIWMFEGDGHISEHVGGYSDWLARQDPAKPSQGRTNSTKKAPATHVPSNAAPEAKAENKPAKKLSYKLQRELDGLPERIGEAEILRDRLLAQTQHDDFYRQDNDHVQTVLADLQASEEQLSALEERWLELEDMSQ